MHFDLSEDHRLLQESVRAFARAKILPHAASFDREGHFPRALLGELAQMGLMGVYVPEDYGGAGLDVLAYIVAMEELSAACASVGVTVSVQNSLTIDPIQTFGTEPQKRRFLVPLAQGKAIGCFALSEPGTGSDAANQQTVCVPDGDGWILNGTKNFITNAPIADTIVVFAMSDKSLGNRGICAFVLDMRTPGVSCAPKEHKLGIRASPCSSVIFEDVRVGPDAMLGRVGEGFKVAMKTLDGGRIGIAAQALGIARQAYEEALQYAQDRQAFGAPISALQAIQHKLADMAMELDAARLLIHRAAWLKDQGQPFSKEAAMAKLYASEMATRVTHQALQVHGGYGYLEDFQAARHSRDARITEIYEGTSEIQRLVVAAATLKELGG